MDLINYTNNNNAHNTHAMVIQQINMNENIHNTTMMVLLLSILLRILMRWELAVCSSKRCAGRQQIGQALLRSGCLVVPERTVDQMAAFPAGRCGHRVQHLHLTGSVPHTARIFT